MKKKSLLAAVTALLAVGGAGVAWQAWHAVQAAEAAAATARGERAPLAAEVARLTRELAITEQRLAELRGQLEKSSGTAAANAATAPVRPATIAYSTVPGPKSPPEAHARALEALKAGLPVKYGAFYRAAGLNAEQVAKFEAIVVEHDGRVRDIRAAEAGIKLDPATAGSREAITVDGRRVQVMEEKAIGTLRREEAARFRSEQVALLGEAGYTALQDFENGGESRTFVGELVGNLALTAAPLSLEQGRQLTRALIDAGFKLKIEPETADWTGIPVRAQAILSPAQFAEFEAQLARTWNQSVGRNELSRRVREWRK